MGTLAQRPGDGDRSVFKSKKLILFCSYRSKAMTLGLLYLESVSSGVITSEEMDWVANNQRDFSRTEEATAIKLGRLLDGGIIHLGCRI